VASAERKRRRSTRQSLPPLKEIASSSKLLGGDVSRGRREAGQEDGRVARERFVHDGEGDPCLRLHGGYQVVFRGCGQEGRDLVVQPLTDFPERR
jgi:hypothetical protein